MSAPDDYIKSLRAMLASMDNNNRILTEKRVEIISPFLKTLPPPYWDMATTATTVAPPTILPDPDGIYRNTTDQFVYFCGKGGEIYTLPPQTEAAYDPAADMWSFRPLRKKMSEALKQAQEKLREMQETLENIAKEPLILYSIEKLSKDKKHAFVKKGDVELRINSVKDLEVGDEVLLHPKTMQIVERLGIPPLETSRFAPDTVPNVHWDDIGGLEAAKQDLREAIEYPEKHKELYRLYRKKPIKGILLSGPPGCGKTMLGKACATTLSNIYGKEKAKTGFLYVKGPEVLNCYVGESEKTIRDIFFDAKRHKLEHGYPAIVFIDEADAILSSRGGHGFNINNTIVPMFLTEMDGLEESAAIIILATNRADVLDPAIVRDGRIDRKVAVARPCAEQAAKILQMNLQKTLVHEDNYEELCKNVAEIIYSSDCKVTKEIYLRDIINGAMLANIVNIAVSYALERDMAAGSSSGVSFQDLQLAVNRIQQQSVGVRHDI